jgi:hypothetical protein
MQRCAAGDAKSPAEDTEGMLLSEVNMLKMREFSWSWLLNNLKFSNDRRV